MDSVVNTTSVQQQLKDHIAAEQQPKPETALTKRTEPVLEEIKGHGQVARDVDGKFIRKSKVALQKNMRESQRFLEQVPEGKEVSRAQQMREAIFTNICLSGPDDLIGQTKGAQFLENSAYGKAKEKILDPEDTNNRGFIIIMDQPMALGPVLTEEEWRGKEKTQPSFADVLAVTTNDAPDTSQFRQHGDKPDPTVKAKEAPVSFVAPAYEHYE